MSSPSPTRQQDSLADVVELLLDKGVVINADIAVSVGETELLGIRLRAAIASFETAAEYGLEFPEGTDMERVEAVSGRKQIDRPDEPGLSEQVTVDSSNAEPVEGEMNDADDADADTDAEATDGDGEAADPDTESNADAESEGESNADADSGDDSNAADAQAATQEGTDD